MLQYVWRDILKGIEKQFIIYSKQKKIPHNTQKTPNKKKASKKGKQI